MYLWLIVRHFDTQTEVEETIETHNRKIQTDEMMPIHESGAPTPKLGSTEGK